MAGQSVGDSHSLLLQILQKLDTVVQDTKCTKQQFDTRLRCVEDQISGIIRKEDHGCADLADVRLREKTGREAMRTRQSAVNDNQMNMMKEEIASLEVPSVRSLRKESGRFGITKSSSFNGQSQRKPRRTVIRHTVPSDKDEFSRINKFRSECLAKSIQWHIVELVQATSKHKLTFPKWIDRQDRKSIEQASGNSNQMRIFLCHLQKKDFETMEEWLNHTGIEESVVKKIWETYEEFSDRATNKHKMKCFYCRLTDIDIEYVIDHLYSAEVICKDLYLQVIKSKPPAGAQTSVWKKVLEACGDHVRPQTAVWALEIALSDAIEKVCVGEQESLRELCEEISEWRDVDWDLFQCQCLVICSNHLHPLSCVRSLTDMYISSPRKSESTDIAEDSPSPLSSTSSSHSSLDSSSKSSEGLHFDANHHAFNAHDQTFPKTIDVVVKRPEYAVPEKQTDARSSARSRRKRMDRKKLNKEACSVETNESADGDERAEIEKHNSYYKALNVDMSSKRVTNKPGHVIYGQNIYLHSNVVTTVNSKKTGDSSSDS